MRLQADRNLTLSLSLALICALGWLFKANCLPTGWADGIQYSRGCYSDAVPFWFTREVGAGKIPYFESPMEYPVLTGAAIWIEGAITRLLFGSDANAGHFLGVVTLANALLAFLVLRLFQRADLPRTRLWLWATAPFLILYVGHNWDMVAIAFAIAAMVFARESKWVHSAMLAALGTAAKLWPALLLPILGLRALFRPDTPWTSRVIAAGTVSIAAIGTWLAVNLVPAWLAFENWSEFYRFSETRGSTAAGSWNVLATMGWWPGAGESQNFLGTLAFFLGTSAIVGVGWLRHRAHLWVLFTPVLAWFMLTNKVYSPQFDLWLYPLLLLTAPRVLPILAFSVAGVAAYFAEFWHLASTESAWPNWGFEPLGYAAAVRAAILLWLIVDSLRLAPPAWITPLRATESSPAV